MSNDKYIKYMIGQILLRYSICKPKMCNNDNIALIIFLWEIDVDRNERRENEECKLNWMLNDSTSSSSSTFALN